METTLLKSLGFLATPGLWIKTDVRGRILSISMDAPSNGLGMIYQIRPDGSVARVFGL